MLDGDNEKPGKLSGKTSDKSGKPPKSIKSDNLSKLSGSKSPIKKSEESKRSDSQADPFNNDDNTYKPNDASAPTEAKLGGKNSKKSKDGKSATPSSPKKKGGVRDLSG